MNLDRIIRMTLFAKSQDCHFANDVSRVFRTPLFFNSQHDRQGDDSFDSLLPY